MFVNSKMSLVSHGRSGVCFFVDALSLASRYDTYDHVMDVLPKLPRPVLVSFQRGEPAWGAAGGESFTSTSRGASTAPAQQADPSGQVKRLTKPS